jgi:hypothetical protein
MSARVYAPYLHRLAVTYSHAVQLYWPDDGTWYTVTINAINVKKRMATYDACLLTAAFDTPTRETLTKVATCPSALGHMLHRCYCVQNPV